MDRTTHCPDQRKKIEKSLIGFRTSRMSQLKQPEKSWRNFQAAFSTHCSESQKGQGYFTYTGRAERHQPVVAHQT